MNNPFWDFRRPLTDLLSKGLFVISSPSPGLKKASSSTGPLTLSPTQSPLVSVPVELLPCCRLVYAFLS